MTKDDYDELDLRFTYHPPTEAKAAQYIKIRSNAMTLAGLFYDNCPDSRERSLAITKVEEAIMWANAAIARREIK